MRIFLSSPFFTCQGLYDDTPLVARKLVMQLILCSVHFLDMRFKVENNTKKNNLIAGVSLLIKYFNACYNFGTTNFGGVVISTEWSICSFLNNAHFISWTFSYHQHSLLLDPARQAALFSFIHNAPDFSCTVDPSGLQGDWGELYWLYFVGATTLIVVRLLAHHALYRRGNLRGACENDQSCSLT